MRSASFVRGVATQIVLYCILLEGSLAEAQVELSASFDWSMPDRYGVDERTMGTGAAVADGVVDYPVTFPQTWDLEPEPSGRSEEIHPSSWQVDLDASASMGAIVEYSWTVDGVSAGETTGATMSIEVPSEGVYEVTLTVSDARGGSSSTTRDVVVQDWLIVALGDSYASGEGNPEGSQDAWFENLVDAYADLQEAQNELDDALDDLASARLELELTQDEVASAIAVLNRWNRECPSISLACANATGDLIAVLGSLGFNNARQIVDQGYQFIRNQITSLTRAAQAAVNAALAAVALAEDAVDTAQGEIAILFQEGAVWQTIPGTEDNGVGDDDRGCHRSSLSGQSLAALALEAGDPRTSVTFVHLACSGAKIGGVVGKQLPRASYLVGEREVDAVIVSIGGNDAGFANILAARLVTDAVCGRVRQLAEERCMASCQAEGGNGLFCGFVCSQLADDIEARCRARVGEIDPIPQESAEELLATGLANLRCEPEVHADPPPELTPCDPPGYARLAREFEKFLPGMPLSRVFITEYPNLVEDDSGEICPDYLTVTHEDWEWMGNTMTVQINDAVREGAESHGWRLVEGIPDGFRRHGYCADDHWVVRAEETFLIQGDPNGVAHPNVAGHTMYGQRIEEAVLANFYPSGAGGLPRTPGYAPTFRRADCNADGAVDISDAIFKLGTLFLGEGEPSCADACDSNDDGAVDITDAIVTLSALFLGDREIPAPGRETCGRDPTDDGIGCEAFELCP